MTYFEGPLGKKEAKWAKFWCVLRGDRLWFFKDRETHMQSSLVGAIAINGSTRVKTTKSKSANYQFMIHAETGHYQLKCGTAHERAQWLAEIGRCARGEPAVGRQLPNEPRTTTCSRIEQRAAPAPKEQCPPPLPGEERPVQLAGEPRGPPLPSEQRPSIRNRHAMENGAPTEGLNHAPPNNRKLSSPSGHGDLMEYSWFYGPLKREKADELLSSFGEVGSFLIRESESTAQSYSLSFRAEERIRHYRIVQQGSGFALAGLENQSFTNLPQLVRYYIQVNEGWAKPMSRKDNTSQAMMRRSQKSVRGGSSSSPPSIPQTPRPPLADAPPAVPEGRKRPPLLKDVGRSKTHLGITPQHSVRQQPSTAEPSPVPRSGRRESEPLSPTASIRPQLPNTPRPPLQRRTTEAGIPPQAVPEPSPNKLYRTKTVQPQKSSALTPSPRQSLSYENAPPAPVPRSAVSLEGSKPARQPYSNWSPQAKESERRLSQTSEDVSSEEEDTQGDYIQATEVQSHIDGLPPVSGEVQYVNKAQPGYDPHDYLDLLEGEAAFTPPANALPISLHRQLTVSSKLPSPPSYPPPPEETSPGKVPPPLPGESRVNY